MEVEHFSWSGILKIKNKKTEVRPFSFFPFTVPPFFLEPIS